MRNREIKAQMDGSSSAWRVRVRTTMTIWISRTSRWIHNSFPPVFFLSSHHIIHTTSTSHQQLLSLFALSFLPTRPYFVSRGAKKPTSPPPNPGTGNSTRPVHCRVSFHVCDCVEGYELATQLSKPGVGVDGGVKSKVCSSWVSGFWVFLRRLDSCLFVVLLHY